MNATMLANISINSTVTPTKGLGAPKQSYIIFKETYHYTWLSFALLIILTNAFVLYVFKSDRKLLRGSPGNNLLLSLAISDLLSGIVSLLPVLPYLAYHFHKSKTLFQIGYMVGVDVATLLLSLSSVIHLCFLAAERYMSIFYALQFKGLVTTRRVRYGIIFAWSISCSIALSQLTWVWPILAGPVSPKHRQRIGCINTYFSAVMIVAFAFFPLLVLSIAYTRMFIMCKTLIRQAPDNLLARKKTLYKEIKILLMYFVMYLVFVFLCVPFFSIRLMVDILTMKKERIPSLPTEMIEAFVLMRYFVSAVNPFIYTLYKQDIRRTIKGFCLVVKVSRIPNLARRLSRIPEGNETITREVSASLGTPMTYLATSRSDWTGLNDTTCSHRWLLPRRSSTPFLSAKKSGTSI